MESVCCCNRICSCFAFKPRASSYRCSLAPSIISSQQSYCRAIKSQYHRASSTEKWQTNVAVAKPKKTRQKNFRCECNVASKHNTLSHDARTMLLSSNRGFINGCKPRNATKSQYYRTFSNKKWRTSVADDNPTRKHKNFLCECSVVSEHHISNHHACSMLLSEGTVSSCQTTMQFNGVVKNTRRGSAAADHGYTASPVGDAVLARDDLLGLIAGEDRGLRTQKDVQKRASIIRVIDALTKLGASSTTTDSSLSATWRMIWTTEKEQLFIIEKAPLFGTQAGDNLQVINIARGTLNNIITFPPSGAFVVGSTIEVVSKQRVNFRYYASLYDYYQYHGFLFQTLALP
ncbi:hypothetical protein O6H91_Y279000 [Diphasiastrum complanatum]|nr:hypothetical protein O6H91_Y279000 [Diphasiastrum complanatum]